MMRREEMEAVEADATRTAKSLRFRVCVAASAGLMELALKWKMDGTRRGCDDLVGTWNFSGAGAKKVAGGLRGGSSCGWAD